MFATGSNTTISIPYRSHSCKSIPSLQNWYGNIWVVVFLQCNRLRESTLNSDKFLKNKIHIPEKCSSYTHSLNCFHTAMYCFSGNEIPETGSTSQGSEYSQYCNNPLRFAFPTCHSRNSNSGNVITYFVGKVLKKKKERNWLILEWE